MSTSSDKLRILYPEFASLTAYTDVVVDLFLGWAALELDALTWGTHFERGSLALAAHMMAISKRSAAAATAALGASSGGIASMSTDQESIAFQAPPQVASAGDGSLGSTVYGLEFIRLRERVVAGPLYVC